MRFLPKVSKSLVLNMFGALLLLGGGVLLIAIIRDRAVNVISTPPAHAISAPALLPTTGNGTTPEPAVSSTQGYVTGMPTRIKVPSLGINIKVIPGYYDAESNSWTLTTTAAQYAAITVMPNNAAGNTFIYGHARNNIFGSLPKIKAGAVATVTTSNGHEFTYRLSSTKVVDPSDTGSVFNYQGKPILTLQTCVGLLYQNRELLTFNLEEVV